MIQAQIVADSLSPQGNRLTTFLVTFPRIILAEVNTHRMFSRNTSSSRAIPFEKMIQSIYENPFIPIAWQKDHKGMQGSEYMLEDDVFSNIKEWLQARDYAIKQATYLHERGVTKQLCNRLLEPFMWTTMLITGSKEGWDNFFELRCPQYLAPENSLETIGRVFRSKKDMIQFYIDNDFKLGAGALKMWTILDWLKVNQSQAEIHMQALAEAMWDAMNESTPKRLNPGEWHIPFGDKIDTQTLEDFNGLTNSFTMIKISTARCARLSYMTFDGKIDYEKDIKLHDSLLESHHMSPFEHCARAMNNDEYYTFVKGNTPFIKQLETNSNLVGYIGSDKIYGWCNNFKGFIQYRYLIENENY